MFIERNAEGDVAGAVQRDANGEFRRIENSDDAAAFYVVYPDNQLLERPDRVVITDSPTEALAKLTMEPNSATKATKSVSVYRRTRSAVRAKPRCCSGVNCSER